jgi:hypothetical protein
LCQSKVTRQKFLVIERRDVVTCNCMPEVRVALWCWIRPMDTFGS